MKLLVQALLLLSLPLGANGLTSPNEVKPFVRGTWKSILAAHAGQPTIAHFWGATCARVGPRCRVGVDFYRRSPASIWS